MKDKFLIGAIIGSGLTFAAMLILISVSTVTIESNKKITPEVQITINGKKIDTIYKYKEQ
jgi:hypothetical protein